MTNKEKFKTFSNNFLIPFDHILRKVSPYIKDDELFVRLHYLFMMHKKLRLHNPQTYNEKVSWLKLHDIHPEYSKLVDKYESKIYVAEKIGKEHIIPTLGLWENYDDIDFDKLPNQFVLKCTHDSQSTVICKDKGTFDFSHAKEVINKGLNRNFFWSTREYPYKDVKPRVIAEEFMVDESGTGLMDYKFLCFNGVPKLMFIATGRPINTCFDFFDMDFSHLDIRQGHPNASHKIKKPKGFEEMKRLASVLSQGFPQIRVDFYDVNGTIYFGELTLFHFGGNMPFHPSSWDLKLGNWIELPQI